MDNCVICTDKFTHVVRKKVVCPYCAFEACVPCVKQYLMNTTKDPHCMNPECSTMWNIDFLNANFTSHWRTGEYRKHRIELLFDRERARLPETMQHLQIYHDIKELCDKKIEEEKEKLHQINNEIADHNSIKHQFDTSIIAFHNFNFTKMVNEDFVLDDEIQLSDEIQQFDATTKRKCAACDQHFTLFMRKEYKCDKCYKKCCLECIQRWNLAQDTSKVTRLSLWKCYYCPHCSNESESGLFSFLRDWCRYVFRPSIAVLQANQQAKLSPTMIENLMAAHKYFLLSKCYKEKQFNKIRLERYKLIRQVKSVKYGIRSIESLLRTVKASIAEEEPVYFGNHLITMDTLQNLVRNGISLTDYGYIRLTTDQNNQVTEHAAESKQPTFVLACPLPDCDGLLSTRYKCNKCETYTCAQCREVKHEDHECDPNTVETVKTLKKDSKPCPSCASLIYRMEGCSQMWCTQCKVGFDWHTGMLEHKNIHNPHYFEYLRQNGLEPNRGNGIPQDNNGCFNIDLMYRQLRRYNFKNEAQLIQNFYRVKNHIQHVMIRDLSYRIRTANQQDPHLQLRVEYILGEINQETFKTKLINLENVRIRNTGLIRIYEMFHTVVSSILGQLNQKLAHLTSKDVQDCLTELQNLCKYVNWNVYSHCKLNKIGSATYVSNQSYMTLQTKSLHFNNMEEASVTYDNYKV